MSTNRELSRIFDQIASAQELLGANRFKIAAHQRAARLLRDMTREVDDLVAEDPDDRMGQLTAIDGIGKGLAEKILEYLDSGEISEHQELLEKVPPGLFDVLEVPGLGPKAVKLMWDELGIASVDDLKAQLDSPELAALPRMGAKTIDNIKKAIAFAESSGDRVPLGMALPLAKELVEALESVDGVRRVDYAGSLRRGRETIGDLDFLVACDDPAAVRDRFTNLPAVTQVLAKGETKSSVRLQSGKVAIQADLRIVDADAYGAALLYFTGSKEHNVRLRELAIQKNLRLNEYGLFEGKEERPQERGEKPVAAAEEAEIYQALGLPYIAPELREDRGELDSVPEHLIELGDIRAELHAHTTASDGRLSIVELAEAAKSRGFHTLAVTDHSQSQVIANGLSPDRLRKHIDAVREANEKVSGIEVLAGSEVDILADGSLDYDDELLAQLDVVVASPHAALRQDPKTATERLLTALRHPLVHILGHPTGRLIGKREGLSPDMDALFAAAAEHDVALELNANWHRLDLRDMHLRGALAAGCKIAIDTDAHDSPHFDFLTYGILTARRAAMTADACINAWSAKRLHGWLKSKR
ncbi:MAG: DNA polymerase/3'-5' exonuclease PolX [Acidobacteriota bacterium]|nr:DNA polymerase/3'-5' exonuclease PolX [Acidobacteriota bacterium]